MFDRRATSPRPKKGRGRIFAALLAVFLMAAAFSACVNTLPVLYPEISPAPTRRAVPITPEPTEVAYATPEPTNSAGEAYDAKGVLITGAEHYTRYITFKNIVVYEEGGDTFLDGIAVNSYLSPISCAVDVVYIDDNGREIARARLQTRDGNYLLVLEPGETAVLGRILTDMTLTDRPLSLEFDKEIGIRPLRADEPQD